ncbi:alpha/beta hydrolase [Roseateles sp. BYS78W]|uniref:Alpha/beta hydrolase n=1 Tax=Pelomonas candidula TaxID=3299025 RepID=A0ABW7H6U5_9BURK
MTRSRPAFPSAFALLLAGALAITAHAQPAAPAASAPQAEAGDPPGSGPFPALKEETVSLPDHVVYRPARLDGVKPRQLGLYVFGNGACSDDGAMARLHLLEIASHGYVAIALGRIHVGPGAAAPAQPAAPRQLDAQGRPIMAALPTSYTGMLAAIDWATAQNADPKSPYFGKFDERAVAASGYSCGGIQALRIAGDPRVRTVVVMNSGLFRPGTGFNVPEMDVPKSHLDVLHTPTLYILGGPSDIAYDNGMDDFARINHVPVAMANLLGVGHGGTYGQPNGGKAATAVVAWLDWQLRGDRQAARAFVGAQCGLCTDPAWELRKKKID